MSMDDDDDDDEQPREKANERKEKRKTSKKRRIYPRIYDSHTNNTNKHLIQVNILFCFVRKKTRIIE